VGYECLTVAVFIQGVGLLVGLDEFSLSVRGIVTSDGGYDPVRVLLPLNFNPLTDIIALWRFFIASLV